MWAEYLGATLKNERVHRMVYPTRDKEIRDVAAWPRTGLQPNVCTRRSAIVRPTGSSVNYWPSPRKQLDKHTTADYPNNTQHSIRQTGRVTLTVINVYVNIPSNGPHVSNKNKQTRRSPTLTTLLCRQPAL